jgi:putative FmdB family regulatory protein
VPTYGYECEKCGDRFEVFQKITEDALTEHDGCGGGVRRLLYPVGIVFKGAGFYVNDYAKQNGGAKAEAKPDTAEKPPSDQSGSSEKPSASDKSDKPGKSDKPETAPKPAAKETSGAAI